MPENEMMETGADGIAGKLQVRLVEEGTRRPVAGADIQITYEGSPDSPVKSTVTDESGMTGIMDLPAPDPSYSENYSEQQPYSEYTVRVLALGYEDVEVAGTEVLPNVTAIQEIRMRKARQQEEFWRIVIGPHTLFGNYPPKIAEPEIKPVTETGEIVLNRVVIPEYVIVHDGVPTDSTAKDYWVRYRDYIKNVASSEIYATWPESALVSNILAIMSFTLNRVYTEWYRNQGYDFTITSSTAYDHKWIYGRNIFDSISIIVDEIFDQYLSRPDVRQPILTQYCDGKRVSCPNWMSQWGSASLGEQGYSPIEILRYYYGDDLYINTAQQIAGIPASWPRYDLTVGSSGPKVQQLQEQLLEISKVYTTIPPLTPTGYYDEATAEAVRAFQNIFGLPQTGVVDFATWYKISYIYVGITRMGELN